MRISDWSSDVCSSDLSARTNLQLFRQSVKERQRALLETSLRSLETAALTARSGTSDEARLRQQEADLILRWVDRAKKIEPSGQVVISQSDELGDLLLENGDIIRVPVKDGLVLARKIVVWGTSGSVRVDHGCRLILKKKRTQHE